MNDDVRRTAIMEYQEIAVISKDDLNGYGVHHLDDIVDQIIEVDKKPVFRSGIEFYNSVLITSELVTNVDYMIRACSNAEEIAEDISDSFKDELSVYDEVIHRDWDKLDDITEILAVHYTHEDYISFVVKKYPGIVWRLVY